MTRLHLRTKPAGPAIRLRRAYLSILVIAMTGVLGCAGSEQRDSPVVYEPKVIDLDSKKLLAESPLSPEQQLKVNVLSQMPGARIQLIQTTTDLAPHYHKRHDEIVFVLQGRGVATIGDTKYKVGPGNMLAIPRKTLHSFRRTGDETHVALSIEVPALEKNDKFFVDVKE